MHTVRLPSTKLFFFLFHFYAWFGMVFKGMGESFLLSKDEPLTPNIDGVMALWIFRRRAQTSKNRQKLAKIGPLDPSFYFFAPSPLGKLNPVHNWRGGGGKKNRKLEFRGPIFAKFRRFSAVWALLLKNQSAITPSILGVRGSSSDSRKLSPIPFDNMPNQA